MVAGCPQHVAGMADPAQPEATGPTPRDATTDLEGVCQPGRGDSQDQGEPRGQDRLAPVGSREGREPEAVRVEAAAPAIGSPVSTTNVMELLEAQNFRCAMTGRALTPRTAALDHIVPIRCGGEHVIENTQILDKAVNRAKGSLTSAEFIGLCREVVTWTGQSRPDGEEATP